MKLTFLCPAGLLGFQTPFSVGEPTWAEAHLDSLWGLELTQRSPTEKQKSGLSQGGYSMLAALSCRVALCPSIPAGGAVLQGYLLLPSLRPRHQPAAPEPASARCLRGRQGQKQVLPNRISWGTFSSPASPWLGVGNQQRIT